jgi:hypothetical protein
VDSDGSENKNIDGPRSGNRNNKRFRWDGQVLYCSLFRVSFYLSSMAMTIHSTLIKNGQEVPISGETNHLGQVKIASSSKAGKWVWVNAKQFRGILKRRAARSKMGTNKEKIGPP